MDITPNNARLALVAAILLDAALGASMFWGIFTTQNHLKNVFTTGAFALVMVGLALRILLKPTPAMYAGARGLAIVGCVGLAAAGALLFLAANFESGISSRDKTGMILTMAAAFALQAAIWWLTIPASGASPGEAVATTIPGMIGFWTLATVVVLVAGFVSEFL